MPRLSREFVKLETRILNDYRFFTMNEFEQLVYVKLLGISRSNSNQIPKNLGILGQLLRTNRKPTEIKSALKRIKSNFPKFKENKYFYWFDGYELRLFNSDPKSPVISGVDEDVDLDVDKDVEEDKEKAEASPALRAALSKISKDGPNIYSLINRLKKEMGQPKDWQFPEDVLLRVCEAYEQDKAKIDKPWPWFVKVIKAESALWHANQQISANDKRGKWAFSLGDIFRKGT